MAVSAEVRWFWEGEADPALTRWFEPGPCEPGGGGESRTDLYLREPNREIGIKARGGRRGAEVKSLVDTLAEVRLGRLNDEIGIWAKITVDGLHLGRVRTITARKTRRLRKFDTSRETVREIPLGHDERPVDGDPPTEGCNVELTDVRVVEGERRWTTLGFEAFGSLATVERNLRRTFTRLAGTAFPNVPPARARSYPAWLSTLGLLTERPDPEALQAVLDAADNEWKHQRTAGKIRPVEWKEFEG